MLSCEDAWWLATMAKRLCTGDVQFAIGPVPVHGEDKTFLDGFTASAEKAPNARGVRRVLGAFGSVMEYGEALKQLGSADALVVTGNYPSDWITEQFAAAIPASAFVLLIDTLPSRLTERADVLLPTATWMEKSGTFENVKGLLQTFDRAIASIDFCKSESQIAMDLIAAAAGEKPRTFNPADTRARMAGESGLIAFATELRTPPAHREVESDMQMVPLTVETVGAG
jgi:NADH-quinone oxidoreductase subunit G